MTVVWGLVALFTLLGLGYGAVSIALGREGDRLVDRYVRRPRPPPTSGEDRIYARAKRRKRNTAPAAWREPLPYERPLEITEIPADLPRDGILPPPRPVRGVNGEE